MKVKKMKCKGCHRPKTIAKGLCPTCYQQLYRFQVPNARERKQLSDRKHYLKRKEFTKELTNYYCSVTPKELLVLLKLEI